MAHKTNKPRTHLLEYTIRSPEGLIYSSAQKPIPVTEIEGAKEFFREMADALILDNSIEYGHEGAELCLQAASKISGEGRGEVSDGAFRLEWNIYRMASGTHRRWTN